MLIARFQNCFQPSCTSVKLFSPARCFVSISGTILGLSCVSIKLTSFATTKSNCKAWRMHRVCGVLTCHFMSLSCFLARNSIQIQTNSSQNNLQSKFRHSNITLCSEFQLKIQPELLQRNQPNFLVHVELIIPSGPISSTASDALSY